MKNNNFKFYLNVIKKKIFLKLIQRKKKVFTNKKQLDLHCLSCFIHRTMPGIVLVSH